MLPFQKWPASWLDDDIEKIVKMILENYLHEPVTVSSEDGECLLLWSCENGDTLLHRACENGAPPAVVKMLLDKCKKLQVINKSGDFSLHKACS